MSFIRSEDISISITSFFMKCVGIWLSANRVEEYCRHAAVIYTVSTILFSAWIQGTDMYYAWGDFGTCIYIGCNMMCLVLALFKIFILFVHRKEFFNLIVHMQQNFWHNNYDLYEKTILSSWKQTCTFLVCSFTFFIVASNWSFALRPLISNIGKNQSDRMLPFNMWYDVPWTASPIFEITFLVQVLCLFHVGICYFCFDNFLCIMNLHVAGQFSVLQYRLGNLHNVKDNEEDDVPSSAASSYYSVKCYASFRTYVQQHQVLITFCQNLEEVFTAIVLVQVLTFSLLICLVGYLVILANLSSTRRLTFVFLLAGNMCQLLMFTYSCDCMIQESTNVASAAYAGPWLHLPMNKFGKMLRKDLLIVVIRSRAACCLTASGFFPVSLETYTAILSTAMSYFTVLKQGTVDSTDA